MAESRQDVVASLARELAATAGGDIDTFSRAAEALRYHGELSVLIEVLRIAWPLVKSSGNVVPWGVAEFAERGAIQEIFHDLEHTASPDPADVVLLDRIHFLIEKPREDFVREFIDDLMANSGREWQADDFALRPPRRSRRDDWGEEEEEGPTRDQGANNLSRLVSEFVGYARREEGMPFSRGELVRQELDRYFVRRNEGELDPRPSLLEQAHHPQRKLRKPSRPAHPLCPERVTLEAHLAGLMGILSERIYPAAAHFQGF